MQLIKDSPILVDHMHIPLQSGSDSVLKRMNRKYDKKYFIEKINLLKKIRPNISITTDVIVGFPGETEEEFLETTDTIQKINFSKLHVFPYSKREGTEAAQMVNQVDDQIKKSRTKILLELSKKLEIQYMNRFIGAKVIAIPEMVKDQFLVGHTGNFLNVKFIGSLEQLGNAVELEITGVNYPYCTGLVCKKGR